MELTIRKHEDIEDWYIIERAEHDGRRWDAIVNESRMRGTVLCTSARVCGRPVGDTPVGHTADIEGTSYEMREIASAIEFRADEQFKRCGVDARTEPVHIGSPRNDNGFAAMITFAEADELAAKIRALLG